MFIYLWVYTRNISSSSGSNEEVLFFICINLTAKVTINYADEPCLTADMIIVIIIVYNMTLIPLSRV